MKKFFLFIFLLFSLIILNSFGFITSCPVCIGKAEEIEEPFFADEAYQKSDDCGDLLCTGTKVNGFYAQ